nr:hypothetical protein CPGR_03567 [Mycolicibacterium komanii]
MNRFSSTSGEGCTKVCTRSRRRPRTHQSRWVRISEAGTAATPGPRSPWRTCESGGRLQWTASADWARGGYSRSAWVPVCCSRTSRPNASNTGGRTSRRRRSRLCRRAWPRNHGATECGCAYSQPMSSTGCHRNISTWWCSTPWSSTSRARVTYSTSWPRRCSYWRRVGRCSSGMSAICPCFQPLPQGWHVQPGNTTRPRPFASGCTRTSSPSVNCCWRRSSLRPCRSIFRRSPRSRSSSSGCER